MRITKESRILTYWRLPYLFLYKTTNFLTAKANEWAKIILITVPTSVLSKVLNREKMFSKPFVGLIHNLNHKFMQIRIPDTINNFLFSYKTSSPFSKNK